MDLMRAFVAVVQSGSFRAGGERLGKSTALVSKYVGKLEERLGTRLLNRTTRSLTLTEDGRTYLEGALRVLDDLDTLEGILQDRGGALSGTLIVSAPVTFGEMYLTGLVERFLALHPDLAVEMRLTDRHVNLIDEGVDLAIRIAVLEDTGLIARRLAPVKVVACAAPGYLAEQGEPETADGLSEHRCVIDTNFRNPTEWSFYAGGVSGTVSVSGNFRANSARAVRDIVRAGGGIGLLPAYAIKVELETGEIRTVLPDHDFGEFGVYAVYSSRRFLAPKIRSFIDFAARDLQL